MSEPIGQGLHHFVLPKDDPVAALNILRVIAEGRCEQPRTTKPRRTMDCQDAFYARNHRAFPDIPVEE
jgi:hypothetical protein